MFEVSLPFFNADFNETPLFFSIKERYGEVLIESILDRIRDQHKTGEGEELDANMQSWLNFKTQNGYYPFPLMMTGELTDKSNWGVKLNKEGGDCEANPTNWNKWIEVMNYRDRSRPEANWDEAFVVSENEGEKAFDSLEEMMDQFVENLFIGGTR